MDDAIKLLSDVVGAVSAGTVPSHSTVQTIRRTLHLAEQKRLVLTQAQGVYHASRLAKVAGLIEKLEELVFPEGFETLLEMDSELVLEYLKYLSKERNASTAFLALPAPIAGAEANDALTHEDQPLTNEEERRKEDMKSKLRSLPPEKLRVLRDMRERLKIKAAEAQPGT